MVQKKGLFLINLGAIVALSAAPALANPKLVAPIVSQAIPLGNGLEQQSGWYGSIHPSVVFGPSFEADSERTQIQLGPTTDAPALSAPLLAPGALPPVLNNCDQLRLRAGVTCISPTDSVEIDDFGLSLETSTGFGISGAVGYRFTPALRAELELGYNRNSADRLIVDGISLQSDALPSAIDLPKNRFDLDGQVETWNITASGYYDIETNSPFKPYLGGGIGIAKVSASGIKADLPEILNRSIDLDDDGVSFIFQVKAGTAYQISDRGSVSLGYRLQGLPGQSFKVDGINFDAKTILTHAVEFGGQYRF